MILGLQNALILGTEVSAVDHFFAAGVRVFALTHMGHNLFADSSRPLFDAELGSREPDAEHGGLSNLGRSAIQRINALGGVVDISQLSKQAALQAMTVSKTPVIASHSNAWALTNVSRNYLMRNLMPSQRRAAWCILPPSLAISSIHQIQS